MLRSIILGTNIFVTDTTVFSNEYDLGKDPLKRAVLTVGLNTQPAGASVPTGTAIAHTAQLQTRQRSTDAWVDISGAVTADITVHTSLKKIKDVAVTVGLLRFVRLAVTALIGGTPVYNDGVLADFELIVARV